MGIVMNLCEHLSVTARLFPEKEAIVFEGRRFSYQQLELWSQAAAFHLKTAGVSRGDRVAVLLPNVPAFPVWYFAALRLGAIAVSLNPRHAVPEIELLLNDCQAKVLVGLSEAIAMLDQRLPACVTKCLSVEEDGSACDGRSFELGPEFESRVSRVVAMEPDEPACILYTSGTTGFSKGATLSHLNVRSNVHAFNHLCNMQPVDRILLAVPLFHCFGQNALLNSAFNVGATLVMQSKFDPLESKRLIVNEEVSQLYGVPMMFQLFLDSCTAADLRSVTYCFSAAAPLPSQTGQKWNDQFGMPIYEGYGLTETSPFASYNHRIRFTPGSIGTPIDCVEMKIINSDSGIECAVGQLGEIAIRGPNVMLGYWQQPEETAQAVRDGWFRSGDIGRQDEDGFFYIVDRVKDMISVGGQKVYPAEVERVLMDLESVGQIAVVGVPDDLFGERVVAYVVVSQGVKNGSIEVLVAELTSLAQACLANYKVPREFTFVDELPRNPSGKVLKTKLREMAVSGNLVSHNRQQAVGGQDLMATHVLTIEAGDSTSDSTSDLAGDVQVGRGVESPTLRGQLAQAYPADHASVVLMFLRQLVKAITGSPDLPGDEARFLDAGLDSLMLVEMSSQVQAELGSDVEVPATLVFDHPRICDLGGFVLEHLTGEGDRADASASKSRFDLGAGPAGENLTGEKLTGEDLAVEGLSKNVNQEITEMSEEEALRALMDELES